MTDPESLGPIDDCLTYLEIMGLLHRDGDRYSVYPDVKAAIET